MIPRNRKVVVIGGGIAGLCTAVYAQRCGYESEVLEMHDSLGGLATSWRRGDYIFETCVHWLLGSGPGGQLHEQWAEVFDIDKLAFVAADEFVCLQNEHGEKLHIYTNIDRLEKELLQHAPEDAAQIRSFAADLRKLTRFEMPVPAGGIGRNWPVYLRDLPLLPLLRRLYRTESCVYGEKFKNRMLQSFFGDSYTGRLSAIALFLSLAWMHQRNASYPIGGSQAIIRAVAERLTQLGGQLHTRAKVRRILIEKETAVGVELTNGEKIPADWVISAADGHETLYDLLGRNYVNKATDKIYRESETFPSYLQVSLGIAKNLSSYPGFLTRILDQPLHLDPATYLNQVSFRIFHYDPTFAPAGKTAVTSTLSTDDYEYWSAVSEQDPEEYQSEKRRVSNEVIEILERAVPGIRSAIEVVDVSTPATVIRYTGNWKGSMEGWLITPETRTMQYPNSIPGLRHFLMAGQWIMPGGGLPAGLLTGRKAVYCMCREDHVPFLRPEKPKAAPPATALPTSASTAAR